MDFHLGVVLHLSGQGQLDRMNPFYDYNQSDFVNILRYLKGENEIDEQLSRQLHVELRRYIDHNAPVEDADGTRASLFYQMLPPEIRQHIFSYLVVVPESIHVYPVKGTDKHGFRLSRCGEAHLDVRNGWCKCENGRRLGRQPAPPQYLDTELLLVSRTVRREVLDVAFLRNHFTFTGLRDLMNFSSNFSKSAARLQNIRLFESLSDSLGSSFAAKNVAKSRRRIGHIQKLELFVYLSGYTSFETFHLDGYLNEIMHFAFPAPESFTCTVRPGGLYSAEKSLIDAAQQLEKKLTDIFTGVYTDVASIPVSPPPPKKVREEEIPPSVKRGILALGD